MAYVHAQTNYDNDADFSSLTVTTPSLGGVTVGNLLIAYCSVPFGETVVSMGDTQGNTWTAIAGSDIRAQVFWAKVTTGGIIAVSFTFSGTGEASGHLMGLIEFSGNAAASIFGASAYAEYSDVFSFDSGTVTTDTAPALLIGFEFGATANITLDADFTLEAATLAQGYRLSYKILTATGTHSLTCTSAGEESNNLFVAWFRGATGTSVAWILETAVVEPRGAVYRVVN